MIKGGRGGLGRATAVFCWLLLGCLAAADDGNLAKKVKADEKNIQIFNSAWEIPTGMVEKKFDTPGGAVYRFSGSVPYSAMYPAWDELRAGGAPFHSSRSCKCSTCVDRRRHYALEASIPPAKKRNMRFVAVEFFIRKFPAMQPDSLSSFKFTLAFSSYPKIGGDLARVSAILDCPGGVVCFFDEACRGYGESEHLFLTLVDSQFGWNHYRIVIDTGAQRLITVFLNGCVQYTRPLLQIKGQSFDINSISIFEPDQFRGSQWLLEISNPIFYRFDHFRDLFALPKVDFRTYPYELDGPNLEKRNRKWQSSRNPDAQYAEAMRILRRQSNDPLPKAIDLLKKASKDDHVFANYELGVCYMYGVGVRRDLDKAKQYFHKAVKRGYEYDTQATRTLLLWSLSPHEIFLDSELFKAFQDCRNSGGLSSYQSCYLMTGFGSILLGKGIPTSTWLSLIFSDDRPLAEGPRDLFYRGRKMLSGCGVEINMIPVSMMFTGMNAPVDAAAGAWYISLLKRYMAEGYGAAFYRFGELWLWQTKLNPKAEKECLTHALTAFKDGARRGDDFCYIESLIIQVTQGTLTPEAFSPETDLRFHRNPRYYLAKYAAAHPNLPWWRDFQFRRHPLVKSKMPPPDTPEHQYLRGLMLLAPYFAENEGYNKVMWRMMENFSEASGGAAPPPQTMWNEAIEGYKLLEEAAEAGIPEAQFLIGMLYLVTPEKTPTPVRWSNDRPKGVKILSQLDPAKWPLASYYLAQYASRQSNFNRKIAEWEQSLKPACDANFGPAWYLLGQLYERYNNPAKAEAAYLKAGDAGHLPGYSAAACLMDDRKRDSRALWQRFLKLHLEARRQNRLDPYDENVTFHCSKDRIPAGYYLPPADVAGLLP